MSNVGFPTHGPTLREVGEQATIDAIVGASPSPLNGDDAAVLESHTPNSRAVVATDMLIEGQHFRFSTTTPALLGRKAIVQNFADIEAMGARPVAALLALSAPPDTPLAVVSELARGIHLELERYSSELVGGDITSGNQLTIAITAIGSLGGSLPPLRLSQARPGQRVIAHGKIGYSAAGFALLESGREIPERLADIVHAHRCPQLTPGRGVVARAAGATAMTDNSDGLLHDLGVITRASNVGINISRAAVAPSDQLREAGEFLGVDPWDWVLNGGEDHTLLGTIDGDAPVGYRSIGTVTRKVGVEIDGVAHTARHEWEPFS
ncbi:thiamine-phosphate kinase [Corynebacterium sp. CCUG 61414]|uniref:thiamine-phosphate kinase n=1 Tax=Corynebacterium sp. CCUG 61414 TaxID=2823896 RepID=UPI00210C0BBC